jgi:hypothetical protein
MQDALSLFVNCHSVFLDFIRMQRKHSSAGESFVFIDRSNRRLKKKKKRREELLKKKEAKTGHSGN